MLSITPQSKGLLTKGQEAYIQFFSKLPDCEQFYLTGGTALAEYYLGHRLSYDLDFFTGTNNLVQPISYQIEDLARQSDLNFKVIRRFSSYVEFQVEYENETLRVDLALDSPYRFEPTISCPSGIWVNNLIDLSVDKLLAFYGRAEPRDAVDLFSILQIYSQDELMSKASLKDPGFDAYWMAIALNRCQDFPDEPDRWPVKMLIEWSPTRIKEEFQSWAMKLLKGMT